MSLHVILTFNLIHIYKGNKNISKKGDSQVIKFIIINYIILIKDIRNIINRIVQVSCFIPQRKILIP